MPLRFFAADRYATLIPARRCLRCAYWLRHCRFDATMLLFDAADVAADARHYGKRY